MTLNEKSTMVNLLYSLQRELLETAEESGADIDETLDEAIKTLICYLD